MIKINGARVIKEMVSPQGTRAAILDIPGLVVVLPKFFGDSRGFFLETYHQQRYSNFGVDANFIQDNLSFSAQGVLRGLHFQNPGAQAKLVSVVAGEVFDVAVDVRHGSPTFGRWAGVFISGDTRTQFYIPKGFAHGFCVLSESAYFTYKCDDFYQPENENTVSWQDEDLGIRWPIEAPKLSAKDAAGVRLRDFSHERLPQYVRSIDTPAK